ncbi:hypothetical protein [Knoellia aerolata]|uniref:Uncharacterized protein n=1 Tax=Knoellia aerolata DSM 18566 TaxID=1385519 RepID=A0A0A0JZC5_9MICO|nr:hypothetical protein [Knoellia aerolata]KGN42064.1 hypothetical protein N801_03010 [Knoellia aerolata DSM 18566]
MTVIAFRPRPTTGKPRPTDDDATAITGSFRSPRGRTGTMSGHLRLQRLVVVPRGAFVTGVFTGELREFDGTLVGVDSRRCTVPADLRRSDDGLQAVIRPLHLDLMGIDVDVGAFAVSPVLPFPASPRRTDPRRRHIVGGLRSIHPR